MGEVIEELPKAIVRRVVKEKISQCSDAGDMYLHKDALLAFSESARIFIHYLSATANDICKESKRQTMNADDVLKAIEEIDFPEFLGPLKATLEDYRRKNSKKRAGAAKVKEVTKKRKEEVPPEKGSHAEDGEVGNNDDNANDQEQQHDADDEDKQDNDGNAEDGDDELQNYGGEDDLDELEQQNQNAADNEEKDPEDATEENDVVSAGSKVRSHEPQKEADEGDARNYE
ncbi:unnamed protein product [Rhodiola kirilowii]